MHLLNKDVMETSIKQLSTDIHELREELLERVIPDNCTIDDLKWKDKTLYHKDKPLLTLYPIKIETIEEDNSTSLKATQRYIIY